MPSALFARAAVSVNTSGALTLFETVHAIQTEWWAQVDDYAITLSVEAAS